TRLRAGWAVPGTNLLQWIRSLGSGQRAGWLGSGSKTGWVQLSVPENVHGRRRHHVLGLTTMKTTATVARIGICLVLAFGCSPLDLGPKDQISDPSFWNSPDQFELAANDFYFRLKGPPVYTEVNSDIAFGSGATVDLA